MRLPIPNIPADNIGFTIYKLFQLLEIVAESEDKIITLDFSNTSFVHCVFLGALVSFIKNWSANGYTVQITNISQDISNYFSAIRFPDGFDVGKQPHLANQLQNYNSKNYTPIVIFPSSGEARENAISTVLNVIHRQCNHTGGVKQAVDYFVSELTNNIADHSNEPVGVVFAQCYPNLGFIDLTIWDNGRGLLASYQESGKFDIHDEASAIQAAVNGKSTKDLPESRGFGLSTSRKVIVEGLDGTFLLWSGTTMFRDNVEGKDILQLNDTKYYKGCFLTLRFRLNQVADFNFYSLIE